jgi:hypothetical protein
LRLLLFTIFCCFSQFFANFIVCHLEPPPVESGIRPLVPATIGEIKIGTPLQILILIKGFFFLISPPTRVIGQTVEHKEQRIITFQS